MSLFKGNWFLPDITEFPGWANQFWTLNPTNPLTNNALRLNQTIHLSREQSRQFLYLFFPERLDEACVHFNYAEESIQAAGRIIGDDADPCFILSYLYFENRWIALAVTFLVRKNMKPSLQGVDAHDILPMKLRENEKQRKKILEAVVRTLGSGFSFLSPSFLKSQQIAIPTRIKSFFLREGLDENGMLLSCFIEQLEIEFEQHSASALNLQKETGGKVSNAEAALMLKKVLESCLRTMQQGKSSTTKFNLRFNKKS